jgi:diacylglycerol kinase family enzyme
MALELERALQAAGHPVRLDLFPDLDWLGQWAAASGPGFSLLIIIGGDGTLCAAAPAAVRHSIPLLPVPAGFGNLFARACQAPRRADAVVELVEHGTVIRADVGVRNGALFLCQESFGLLSDIQLRMEDSQAQPRPRWRRWLAYYQTALQHLRDTSLPSLRVEVDGRVVAEEAVVVTVANVECYGRWLPLTPAASPVDGRFDIFVMAGPSKRQILGTLLRRQLRLPGGQVDAAIHRGRHVSVSRPPERRDELHMLPGLLPVMLSPKVAEAWLRGTGRGAAGARRRVA